MTADMLVPRWTRLLVLGGVVAILIALLLAWYTTRDPRAQVVDQSTDPTGWKTIEYEGLRVGIPATWERSDRGDCEFQFEHWGPPDSPPCRSAEGVAFYASATFDPADRPGIMETQTPGPDSSRWAGYVYARDFAVYAADEDRDVVEGVLGSAK